LADPDDIARAARGIRGADAVLVALGTEGAVLVEGSATKVIPPFRVQTADTAPADDCLCGALACALAAGQGLAEAAFFAVAAAALSTTGDGSQSALPTRDEVERLLATGS